MSNLQLLLRRDSRSLASLSLLLCISVLSTVLLRHQFGLQSVYLDLTPAWILVRLAQRADSPDLPNPNIFLAALTAEKQAAEAAKVRAEAAAAQAEQAACWGSGGPESPHAEADQYPCWG